MELQDFTPEFRNGTLTRPSGEARRDREAGVVAYDVGHVVGFYCWELHRVHAHSSVYLSIHLSTYLFLCIVMLFPKAALVSLTDT